MKNSLYILAFFFLATSFLVSVQAQEGDPFADIAYPIPELGNCTDKNDCLNYCDAPDNMEACLDFAEANNLMPEEDIEMGKKMLAAGETTGPGGCQGVAECGEYCDDINHIKECVAFAEKHDLMPAGELEEAKKVAAALDRGVEMPPCSSKTECDDVCRLPENMKTCITFAKEAGLMSPEELEEVEKVLLALEKGITPPPCGGKDECDAYCSLPENLEGCITFAEAAGFMSPEEAAMVRRTGGQGPGGCRGKEACEAYCEDPANMEPCINFAIENGFMSSEEAEQAKKMMAAGFTSGPGGCKGQEECEEYCEDFTHMEECVSFAEKAGFMSAEDAARARQMMEKGINMMQGGPGGCKGEEECRSFCDDPANMEECFNFAVQIGDITPEEAEEMRGNMEMMRQGGPGGCTSEEECVAYCEDPAHGIECINFSVQIGQMSPEEGQGMMEMMQGGGEMMPPEGFEGEIPEGMMPEEFEEQFEEQFQREFEKQMQQQIQRVSPQQEIGVSPEFCLQNPTDPLCPGYKEAPISPGYCTQNPTDPLCQQSFFEQIKNFLAGLVSKI